MTPEQMDEAEVFRCNVCGRFTRWEQGGDDDMPGACDKCFCTIHDEEDKLTARLEVINSLKTAR